MDKMKRMTLDDIIAAKLQHDNDILKVKEIVVPSTGGTLLFKRPTDKQILGYLDNLSDKEGSEEMVDGFAMLIYECCEELQNQELQEKLEITNPPDTVYAFMDAYDILTVGNELGEMNRLYGDYADQEKN